MKLQLWIFSLVILCVVACTPKKHFIKYSRDYVEVGKLFSSVQLPYTLKFNNENKRLLAIGIAHTYNSNDPQLSVLKELFQEFSPDVTLNEGGQITKEFKDEKEAVASSGEAGLLKYLSDLNNKKLLNGDVQDSLEYKIMLNKHSKDDLLLYYIMERLIVPYLNGAHQGKSFEDLYELVIQKWFIDEGFPVDEDLRTFSGYQKLYRTKIGHDLEMTINPDIELFDYVNPDCKYCAIGRASKIVRDSVLLEKINAELKIHDKVMVVFGHGHILAIEPALKIMMEKFPN
ncbi:hypothetical protein RYH73_11630 [Olivibacter sp. CPCC 100613]|uniref:hypothetical protein n=1 Tax=Olivibacter sp. CPCC 100613 TaxID=3079931 RepID=UPI002FF759DA